MADKITKTKSEKAKIIVLGDNDGEESTIEVMFNPDSYVVEHNTSYQDTPISGTDQVVTQFSHGNPSTLKMELFFETSTKEYVDGSVVRDDLMDKVKKFIGLVYVKSSLHRPPRVKFQWGSLNFTGMVTNITTEFKEFENSGQPIRATVKIELKEYINSTQSARKTPFESPDRSKVRQLTEGKSLWHIAYEEYGDMGKWKAIAEGNNAVHPFDMVPGQYIKIPAL